MKKACWFLVLCCTVLIGCNSLGKSVETNKVNLILDTDLGPDYDDVGAMAVMHALADSGQVNILATISCNKDERVIPCIEVLNFYFKRPDIPIGAPKGLDAPSFTTWHQTKWTDALPAHYPHRTKKTTNAPDAVQVYRKILSEQPDRSVTICTIGFFTNLKGLLESGADTYSPLSGKELVAQKVVRLVSMAGGFPEGREYNVFCDTPASLAVTKEWPTEIVFSGWEIGDPILTGKELVKLPLTDSPVKEAYALAFAEGDPNGRMSWDQTAVLVAIKGIEPYFLSERGTISVDNNGGNTWMADPQGKHIRLIRKHPPMEIAAIIEMYMMHQPINK
ncbi:nucleoside hydrolase [Parabacteroides sp. PF5-6]|uniref:nucleoside hydrolase n=1 Tax=Parabacteroides sp. PF5-6 TaxID=1742403 RepID=UPI0024058D1B|nr:nucleoside hydrolase [Parabacteroides sp. PF5-6]MDF9830930.1 purine nucleosidase [Parabacteroides sp. PF5-6]